MKPLAYTLIFAILAGCAGPEPHIYVLDAAGKPASGVRSDTGRMLVELKPVLVPDYLDSTDILLRTGSNELTASRTGVWGERLSAGITRALAADLVRLLPRATVVARPPPAQPARQILVDVTGLQARAQGDCVLTARWTIVEQRNNMSEPQVLASADGSFTTHAVAPGDAALVAAITAAIGQLASQIAAGADMD
jgi:uncharacterized lipoprotein YmbA